MSAAQVAAVLRRLDGMGADLVNVGHGRGAVSAAVAGEFVRAWGDRGGEIGAVVDWPCSAASWLRPARRLAAGPPDAWVVADTPEGWARLCARLVRDTEWDPGRTVALVTRDGGGWAVADGAVREW